MPTSRKDPDKEHKAPSKVDDIVHVYKIVDTSPCTLYYLYVHVCWNISLGMGDYSADVFRKGGVGAGF
jgi:hypothetical protein